PRARAGDLLGPVDPRDAARLGDLLPPLPGEQLPRRHAAILEQTRERDDLEAGSRVEEVLGGAPAATAAPDQARFQRRAVRRLDDRERSRSRLSRAGFGGGGSRYSSGAGRGDGLQEGPAADVRREGLHLRPPIFVLVVRRPTAV